jgi:microcystin-dependent protein
MIEGDVTIIVQADTSFNIAAIIEARDEAVASAAAAALSETSAGADATATAADRVQTGLDATATAADRVQTGLDRVAASDSAAAAAASAASIVPSNFATAAQGALADTATQPGDNISTLTNDAGYITSTSGVPSGAVMSFAMNTAPTGWLKANGATVSRATYAALFAAIGTTYGAGDGSTTFGLPDMRGEFARGWDDGRGVDSGRGIGTAQLDQMQRITGSVGPFLRSTLTVSGALSGTDTGTQSLGGATARNFGSVDFDSATSPDARVSATTAGETRARNVALLYCIKT